MCNQKTYFNSTETTDFSKFIEFNNRLHLFTDVEKMPVGHWSDVTAKTSSNERRYVNIELKDRSVLLLEDGRISGHSETSGKDFIDDGVMMETHKAGSLFFDRIVGLEPLYINFLLNGVVVFHLDKLTIRPRTSKKMNIKSKGYKKFEIAKREFLDIKDATVYDNNLNIVKRMGEEWKGWKKNS